MERIVPRKIPERKVVLCFDFGHFRHCESFHVLIVMAAVGHSCDVWCFLEETIQVRKGNLVEIEKKSLPSLIVDQLGALNRPEVIEKLILSAFRVPPRLDSVAGGGDGKGL